MLSALNISKLYEIYKRPADRLKEALWFGRKNLHQDFWPCETSASASNRGNPRHRRTQRLGQEHAPPNPRGNSAPYNRLGLAERRVSALLELGAGFNPEFTGRENVFINGELLGLSRAETLAAMPAIEEFAGIGDFVDRPVKTYSSGMYVRLAFSTAIHVEPDILIVDEALAVGDAAFSSRCVRKFEQLQQRGVTTVLVSHDLGLVKQVCNRAVFLLGGRIEEEGTPTDVVNRYVGSVLELPSDANGAGADVPERSAASSAGHRHGDRLAEITNVELYDSEGLPRRSFQAGEPARLVVTARFHKPRPEPMIGMLIRTRTGMDVFGTNTRQESIAPIACEAGESIETEFAFDCRLTPQEYTLTVAVQHHDGHSHDWLDDVLTFEVTAARRPAGVADLTPKVTLRKSSSNS